MNTQEPRETQLSTRQATAREFLSVMFRRKWIILGIFIVTTLTVATVTLTTPTEYVSSGRVLIKRGEQTSALDADRRIYSDWEQELSSELELVRSVPILDRTRERLKQQAAPGAKPLPLQAGQVDVEVMGKSNVIGIAYHDRDPEVAYRVCDALISTYLEYRQSLLGLVDPRRFFDTEITLVRDQLDRKTEMRRLYSDQANVVDLVQQRGVLLGQLSGLELQRSSVGADLAEARANSQVMHDLEQKPEVDLPITGTAAGGEYLVDIKHRVLEAEARLNQIRERYREESPEVASARQTLESLRQMLKREVAARLQVAGSRVTVLEKRLEALDQDIAQVRGDLSGMPDKQARIGQLDRDIETLQRRYQELVSKSDLARITDNTRSRVAVLLLSPAGPAAQRNARDYVRLALAPAFSLVVGIGLAFFLDGLDITMHTSSQAEEASEIPVLATLRERRRRAQVTPTRS